MKKIIAAAMLVGVGLSAYGQKSQNSVTLKTSSDSLSYAYGAAMVEGLIMGELSRMKILIDTKDLSGSELSKAEAKNKATKEVFLKGLSEGAKVNKEKHAQIMGTSIGAQLNALFLPSITEALNLDEADKMNSTLVLSGVSDALMERPQAIDNADDFLNAKGQELQEKGMKKKHAKAISEGKAYMEENAARAEVTTLPSGVQYEVITEGEGAIPSATDRVKVHYVGTLTDGTTFDSSIDRGTPTTFGVTQVISAWTEALQLMPVGSKWRIVSPPEKAYGASDMGQIPPYSTLIFEIDLLGIE